MNGGRDHSGGGWQPVEPIWAGRRSPAADARARSVDGLFVLGAPASRWTDALAAETRAQIGGCLNAIELAIGLNIMRPATAAVTEALGPAYCRQALEAEPQLLAQATIDHFRFRAALVLVARGAQTPVPPQPQAGEDTPALLADEPDPTASLIALNLAEARWLAPAALDAPIRPDLPADIYADLAWAAAALLVQGCERQTGETNRDAIDAIGGAAALATARHDEAVGPYALAMRFARAVEPAARGRLANMALRERRLLLFAALAAQALNLALVAALAALLDDVPDGRIGILHAMGIEEETALRTAQALSIVDGAEMDSAAIAHFIEGYRRRTDEQTEAVIAGLSGPEPLAMRLALIDRGVA